MEFLIEHFNNLFTYDYTSNMEMQLDEISKGNATWYELCDMCLKEINTLSKDLLASMEDKVKIVLDEYHTYMIAKFGPVIKYTKNDETKFYPVKPDIDIDKLRRKEYKIEDIIQEKQSGKILGKYKSMDVMLKKGKYGTYIEYGTNKKSVNLEKTFDEIEFKDIEDLLTENKSLSMIRKINEYASIRTGQYGDYIFYKKPSWKKLF